MKSLRYLWLLLALAAMPAAGQRPGFRAADLASLKPVEAGGGGGGGGGFYYPTNLPSQAAYVWYESGNYTTNASVATWEETLLNLDATNTVNTAFPQEGPALNGKRTVNFDGGPNAADLLYCLPFDTGGQPYSFHFVIVFTNVAATSGVISSTNASGNNYVGYNTTPSAVVRASTSAQVPGFILTNKWMSVAVVVNGASSQYWTNGVQLGSDFNPGTSQWIGLEFGRIGGSSTFDGRFTIAEMSCYTNVALTSANISNLFSYATNVYAFGY